MVSKPTMVMVIRLLVLSCAWGVAAPRHLAAGPASELETREARESYSIGYQVGQSLNTDGVQVDLEKVIEGLRDAVDRKAPRVKDEEMRKLVVDLKKRAREAQLKKMQEQIVKNAQESEKFLEENKTKDGVKVTESGLQYKVLKEGQGPAPGPQDFVKVNYRGTFIDGTEFDSSYAKGEPARVQTDGVIKGWTEALQMMKTGSRWQLFVPPELAYGRAGLGQRIPPNKVLVFDIELLAVEKGEKAGAPPVAQAAPARKMSVTGEIGKSEHGYIIRTRRGGVPTEILTVLNPDPKLLDPLVKSEKTVPIEVRVVTGDNVEIEKIEGRAYRPAKQ